MVDWLHSVLGQIRSEQIAPIGFYWGKPCDHSRSFIFDWFFFIYAWNEDNHNVLDGFEIRQDPTKDL